MPPATLSLRERALQALRRSEKTRAQLQALLLRHASPAEVTAVLDALEREHLLSDARAAESAAHQAQRKGQSAARIVAGLESKGVSPALAQAAAREAVGDQDERASLRARAASLLGTSPSLKDRQRVARRLLRLGYAEDDVADACGLSDQTADQPADLEDGP